MRTRIRYWRNLKNMTMEQLGEKAGIARESINNIEHGYRYPRPTTRAKIANALGIKQEQIFTSDNDPEADGNWKNPAKEEPPAA